LNENSSNWDGKRVFGNGSLYTWLVNYASPNGWADKTVSLDEVVKAAQKAGHKVSREDIYYILEYIAQVIHQIEAISPGLYKAKRH
jgi:hypothetical protein